MMAIRRLLRCMSRAVLIPAGVRMEKITNAANYGGCCDWFEFRMDKWGVINDAGTEDLVEVKDGSITIRFASDNQPPCLVFRKILAMFPTLNLVDRVDCEGAGCWTIKRIEGRFFGKKTELPIKEKTCDIRHRSFIFFSIFAYIISII